MAKQHYTVLDGLRGIVAILVSATHCHIILGHQLIRHGYLAVDFFFILSGFVIADAYETRLKNDMSKGSFILVRAIRLYPMIILGALIGAAAAAITTNAPTLEIAAAGLAATFVLPFPNHGIGYGLWPINPPAWSLFWEIVISGVFAVALYRWSTRALSGLALVAMLALIATAITFKTLEVGYLKEHFWGGAARVTFAFAVGQILNRLHKAEKLPRWNINVWVLAFAVTLVLAFPMSSYRAAFDLCAVIIIFPAIIVAGLTKKVMHPLWAWLSRVSYPLYMIHYPMLVVIEPLILNKGSIAKSGVYMLAITGCVIIAGLVLISYDEPLRALLSRSFRPFRSRLNSSILSLR